MIRSPDEYRTERLINNNNNSLKDISYVDQMKLAIEISRQDYSDTMEQMEEQQILELHLEQCKNREKEISVILLKIKKVSKYDKELDELLFIIEEIFSQYTNGYIDSFNSFCLEEEIKTKIWKNLLQIRFTEDEKNILKKIIN